MPINPHPRSRETPQGQLTLTFGEANRLQPVRCVVRIRRNYPRPLEQGNRAIGRRPIRAHLRRRETPQRQLGRTFGEANRYSAQTDYRSPSEQGNAARPINPHPRRRNRSSPHSDPSQGPPVHLGSHRDIKGASREVIRLDESRSAEWVRTSLIAKARPAERRVGCGCRKAV